MRKPDNGHWGATKVIEIPAEPSDPELLPPLLKGFKAVPPLVTDINLSLDDKWLYVSCWGTGELRRYDVSTSDTPKLTSVVQIGGIVRRAPHPKEPNVALSGGPQMVEISRDGIMRYVTGNPRELRFAQPPGTNPQVLTCGRRSGHQDESRGAGRWDGSPMLL